MDKSVDRGEGNEIDAIFQIADSTGAEVMYQEPISWSISDTAIATITPTPEDFRVSKVRLLGAGTEVITARALIVDDPATGHTVTIERTATLTITGTDGGGGPGDPPGERFTAEIVWGEVRRVAA